MKSIKLITVFLLFSLTLAAQQPSVAILTETYEKEESESAKRIFTAGIEGAYTVNQNIAEISIFGAVRTSGTYRFGTKVLFDFYNLITENDEIPFRVLIGLGFAFDSQENVEGVPLIGGLSYSFGKYDVRILANKNVLPDHGVRNDSVLGQLKIIKRF